MPIIDMPLAELLKYKGRSICPENFNCFWDQSIDQLKKISRNTELIKSEFRVPFADCYHLYFSGIDGARIHAKFLKPKTGKDKLPAILHFHGYQQSSGEWSDKLKFVAQGYAVASLDCRGQGGYSQDSGGVSGTTVYGHVIQGLSDGPEKMLYRQIFLDALLLAWIVMEMEDIDENNVATMGASQGGALSLVCASLEPRIKKTSALYPFLCDFKRVWEMDMDENAYAGLRNYFRYYDPRHQREAEVFEALGYIDVQNFVHRIQSEVMMGTGLMDTICPPSTQFSAYNKIKSKKNLYVYPDFGHEKITDFEDMAYLFLTDNL